MRKTQSDGVSLISLNDKSPLEDADVYIDFQNKGFNTTKFTVPALGSIRVADPKDKDMSGASIFAVKKGTGLDGPSVDIAVAWGQDPSVSRLRQDLSMDMGTVTLPFTNLKISKLVDKTVAEIGDELTYTIRVTNVGQRNVNGGIVIIKDVLDASVSYIPQSVSMKYNFGDFASVTIQDSTTGTPFPLDSPGYTIPVQIPRRGASLDISFRVQIAADLTGKSRIVNTGTLSQPDAQDIPYETTTIIDYKAAIAVDNTVVQGSDGSICATNSTESVSDKPGANVTYCFKISNTGRSYLANIQVNNTQLGKYSQMLQTLLAPNSSITIVTTQPIVADGKNDVVITASPVYSSGMEISDATRVMATDSSSVKVIPFMPNITIDNRVYIGNDGSGTKCHSNNATETAVDIFETPVTYCFTVRNNGDTWLNQVFIENKALNYTFEITDTMAPNETRLVFYESSIKQDLSNMAFVSGQPVDSAGLIVPLSSKVVSQDSSSVTKLSFIPSIGVENTVYLGNDGGNKCGTAAAVEFVSDFFNSPVTYCFKITNTGETALANVSIVNNDISYSNYATGKIASGSSVMLHRDGTISQSIQNVVTVAGTPEMEDGRGLGDLSRISSSDASEVGLKDNVPSVSITNHVVLGHDRDCHHSTEDIVEGFPGTNVTYCFFVKNTGDSYLDNIVVANEQLSFSVTVPILAPGLISMIALQREITTSLQNIATVTANPTLVSGVDIPGVVDVSASDPSSIVLLAYSPAVEIANKVYLGSDDAKSCDTAVEFVEGRFGDDVAYCFNVTNTGNTYLKNLKIDNVAIAFRDNSLTTLAPGQSTTVSVGRKITWSIDNTVSIVATPSNDKSESLAIPDVTYSDTSSVVRIAHLSNIKIDNRVYLGTTENDQCQTNNATKLVSDIYMTNVVYCFQVTNSGDSYLNGIIIENKAINFTQKLTMSLPPGGIELLKVPGNIIRTIQNVATVTANPILQDGTDIEGMPDVSSNDTSSVGKLSYVASVQVSNTVYKGVDGTSGCSNSTETVTDLFGADITYCFRITNTGNATLKNVVLSNAMLVYADSLLTPLRPKESILVSLPSKISSAFINSINVAASPTTVDGRDILDLAKAQHSDTSSVSVRPHSPNISVSNTVYLGVFDNGANCAAGVEAVDGEYNSDVTYCFKIQNKGNTYLNDVSLSNQALGLANITIAALAPGASTTYSVGGLITGTMLNMAIVKGSPRLQDGSNIPNAVDVSASDPSSITQSASKAAINIENTVYLGVDGGDACSNSTMDSVVGYLRSGVTFCMEVTNTGNTSLANITIVDIILQVDDSTILFLAPGASKRLSVSRTISGNVTNNASVIAFPALKDGRKIPNVPSVTDSDTSSVIIKAFAPAIKIDNVVGFGRGVDSCVAARSMQEGFFGDEITYCFIVTNVGDTILINATIVDNVLSYSGTINKSLAPGESTTLSVDSYIGSDLINTAVVSATPAYSDSTAIVGLDKVEHSDQSEINKFDLLGGVLIDNVVYDGRLGGASCASGLKSIEGKYGTPVQYCFTVTNTGETYLNGVAVSNTALGYFNNTLKVLAPGESITFTATGKVTDSKENVATVTANPITKTGKDILDLNDVSSNDASSVTLVASTAAVTIANKVYSGVNGGASCNTASATDIVGGYYGTPVTYCFEITNTGETFLSNVTISNEALAFFDDFSIPTIAPGEKVIISFANSIFRSLQNSAVVTGLATIQDGSIIPDMPPISSSDDSTVSRIPHNPSIDIENTVYIGDGSSNNGQSNCGFNQAVDMVEDYQGALVTYCFEILNKGDTFLSNVTLIDDELSFEQNLIAPLAPGGKTMLMVTTTINSTLKNTAFVTANPTLEDGTDIPDLNDVSWSDTSTVTKLDSFANITVENHVYIGNDDGASCGNQSVAMKSVSGKIDTDIIYCFNIINNGDVYLRDVVLTNFEFNYQDKNTTLLAPQASKMLIHKSKISGNVTNSAVVTAHPASANGALIANGATVTANDSSDVSIKSGMAGNDRFGDNEKYLPPSNSSSCLYDNWLLSEVINFETAGDLVCATKEVFVEALSAQTASTCGIGDYVTVTIDATINIDGSRSDLGWYIATDGGDALTGTCVVNGLQNNGAVYELFDTNTVGNASRVEWISEYGGDDDDCGDVLIYSAGHSALSIPILVEATLPCQDENDDGALDFAICFTWKADATNGLCTITNNIPNTSIDCYCTRVDVSNVEIVLPNVVNPIELC